MAEFNPPEDWAPPAPPTDESETFVLTTVFGLPDENGVYAPYVEA